jgi:hypothetical protein
MRRHSRYLVGCCAAAVGLGFFLVGLQVSATTSGPPSNQQSSINRSLKGDRLLPLAGNSRNAVNGPADIKAPRPTTRPELPEGCEPVVSTIGQPPLARVAGRCLS